ncbi:MAG: accessory factor UbiK family protein [Rhodocyclaceae bacterium]|nr:accessory factor UbiK family protein [Rhodocyclaceae bacterium]
MSTAAIFESLSEKFAELAANNPVAELEKNAKSMLAGAFDHLDLVQREEHEVLRDVLERALMRIEALENRVAQLEGGKSTLPPI